MNRFTKCHCDESGLSPTTPCRNCPRRGEQESPSDPKLTTVVDLARYARDSLDKKLSDLSDQCARDLFVEQHEPTEESAPEGNLRALKLEPDADVIKCLEAALEDARSGNLRGVLVFGVQVGKDTTSGEAGATELGSMIVAFEHWKYRVMRALNE